MGHASVQTLQRSADTTEVISPNVGQVLTTGDVWVYGIDGPGYRIPRKEWDRRNAARAALERLDGAGLTVAEVRCLLSKMALMMTHKELSAVLDVVVSTASGVQLLTKSLDGRW